MATEHPFQTLFESLGHLPIAHAEAVNRQAYEILYDILSVPTATPGRCILLRAPRAGHGKTHLLSRIQHHLGASHEFIPLRANFGSQIDTGSVVDDALRRLLRPLPASGGLCVLDLLTRRLFSLALQPLVDSGEVPCQDRQAALMALRTRPIEIFDFHHPQAVTAHWAQENFAALGPRFAAELAQRCGLPILEVGFWIDALFRFVTTAVDDPSRLRVLLETVHGNEPAERVLLARLESLLGLLTLLMRVVLVADSLEGFSTDEMAALRLAAFLADLRQAVPRVDVILSLNQDIWQNAFVPRLSDGFADRLSEVVIELNPLTEDEMLALLESRVPGLGKTTLTQIDREAAGTHARGLIRAAGIAWLRASAMDAPPAVAATAPPPPELPPPAVEPSRSATAVPALGITTDSPFEVVTGEAAVDPPPPPVPPIPATTDTADSPFEIVPDDPPLATSASPRVDPTHVDTLVQQFMDRYGHNRR